MTYISKNPIKQLSATTGTIALANSDIANDAVLTITATGAVTLNQTTAFSITESTRWILEFTQDGVGSRTLTLGTNILTPGGVAPFVSAAINATDVLVFETDSAGSSRLIEHRKAYA